MDTRPPDLKRVVAELTEKRQDKLLKWTAVAQQLGITPQHLLRIRNGDSPISEDVAAAIDRFLDRPRGYTWKLLGRGGAPLDPTDEELAAMTVDEAKAYIIRVGKARGVEAAKQARLRIQEAWDRALLVEEPGNR